MSIPLESGASFPQSQVNHYVITGLRARVFPRFSETVQMIVYSRAIQGKLDRPSQVTINKEINTSVIPHIPLRLTL
jgi:hypothetical protein